MLSYSLIVNAWRCAGTISIGRGRHLAPPIAFFVPPTVLFPWKPRLRTETKEKRRKAAVGESIDISSFFFIVVVRGTQQSVIRLIPAMAWPTRAKRTTSKTTITWWVWVDRETGPKRKKNKKQKKNISSGVNESSLALSWRHCIDPKKEWRCSSESDRRKKNKGPI